MVRNAHYMRSQTIELLEIFFLFFLGLYFDHNFTGFSGEKKVKCLLPLVQGELVGDDYGGIDLPGAHQRLEIKHSR